MATGEGEGELGGPFSPPWRATSVGIALLVTLFATGVLVLDLSPEQRRGADTSVLQISHVTGSSLCIGLAGAAVGAAERGAFGLGLAVGSVAATMAVLAVTGAVLAGRARPAR